MDERERRARMAEGRASFNRRAFFAAHEAWEDVWRELDAPARTWVQGLIVLAAALHKLDGGRPDLCAKLVARALAKLVDAPAALLGIDVAGARAAAGRIAAALARGEPVEATEELRARE